MATIKREINKSFRPLMGIILFNITYAKTL